jgi:dTDP-4-dehydrorhamnose 3,5-epimerase
MLRVVATALPGVLIIEPDVFRDDRGFFLETYHEGKYRELGLVQPFVQDNHSWSRARTLRGLHFQRRVPQGKLVRVVQGVVMDVAVDVRRGSPTFGKWVAMQLSADNFRQSFIPPGFAHGFYVVDGPAQVEYKCTAVYDGKLQAGIRWNDPGLAIDWPDASPLLSDQDARLPLLAEAGDVLPTIDECPSPPAELASQAVSGKPPGTFLP